MIARALISHIIQRDKDFTKNTYMTTPVIVIDGSVIVGFDAEKIDQAP